MDFGCIDMGCVEKPRKETSLEKDDSPKESVMSSASKSAGKNNKSKDVVRSSLNALNKLTSQISKPPRRRTSPVNWFPRKKVEPYLKRKIKMLQEVDGMHSTLDETLGDSNPHYSRVLREKIAIREAAEKAMEARKAAMVEASWCRILQAARGVSSIETKKHILKMDLQVGSTEGVVFSNANFGLIGSKEAEAQLAEVEHSASEALEAARAAGVIMNDSQNHYRIETSSSATAHTVSATFETAFDVDKQVGRAVKAAFIKLANCPSMNKDEFKELLLKISENPETDINYNDNGDASSDCTSECEPAIVDMMLSRIRCLKEGELASLATIVATSGLNAALSESGNSKRLSLISAVENDDADNACLKVSRRTSVRGNRGKTEVELPSLDKFLVKRLTRLEREVLEAKDAGKNETGDEKLKEETSKIPNLESVLVKHCSKLEKEAVEARMNYGPPETGYSNIRMTAAHAKQDFGEVPSLDKFLVKRLTRLEREVEEARRNGRKKEGRAIESVNKEKENMDMNKNENANAGSNISSNYESLDKVLVKRVSRLEKEKLDFRENANADMNKNENANVSSNISSNYESLDKVLVKRVSRLEKEKMNFCEDERTRIKPKQKGSCPEPESSEGSLDQVLVKHRSRLEREKMCGVVDQQQKEEEDTRHSVSRRQARERELHASWGGLSLGNSMRPHVSKLQKDKAAWLKAEEDETKRGIEDEV
ncbi:hypothetical protein OROHE_015457 [Orobanche hederae]